MHIKALEAHTFYLSIINDLWFSEVEFKMILMIPFHVNKLL